MMSLPEVRCSVPAVLLAAFVPALLLQPGAGLAQTTEIEYQQLPAEIRDYVEDIRDGCAAMYLPYKNRTQMQGISVIHLGSDNARAIMVDAEHLCSDWVPGANCSNRGCDLKIWKQTGQEAWEKVFDEHLHAKTIDLGEDGRLQSMNVSVYAGGPHCDPEPGKSYTSGQACNAVVTYGDNDWHWEKVAAADAEKRAAPAPVAVAYEPQRGSAERAAILDAVRPEAINYLGSPVEFVVKELKVADDRAYASLRAQRPGGAKIDLKDTPWGRGPYYSEPIDYPGLLALLRRTGGQWVVAEHIFSPTDVPFGDEEHCREWRAVLPKVWCK